MKLFLKIIGAIIAVLILAFAALFAVFYFNPELGEEELTPEQVEIQKIYDAVETQTGNIHIESINQINTIIIPLARQLIVGTFPTLASRTVNSVSVLEDDAFNLKVAEQYVKRNMTEEDSLQTAVVLNQLGGVAFCPTADVYLKYPGNGLYILYYLDTAIHELLHALTCESKISAEFPAVWEESFTEYFTMRVLSKYIGMNTDRISSSPERIKVIKNLHKFVSGDELFRIYLTKDGAALEKSIDNALGRGTYDALNADMEIVFRQSEYTYIEHSEEGEIGTASNPRVEDALQRIDNRLNPAGQAN